MQSTNKRLLLCHEIHLDVRVTTYTVTRFQYRRPSIRLYIQICRNFLVLGIDMFLKTV